MVAVGHLDSMPIEGRKRTHMPQLAHREVSLGQADVRTCDDSVFRPVPSIREPG
jgi:hypothetical protein